MRATPNCCLYATWDGSGSTLAPLVWGDGGINGETKRCRGAFTIHPIYRCYRSCPSTRFIAIIALAHSQSIQLDLSLLSRRSLLSLSPKSASRLKSTYPFPKKSSFRYSSQATMANALETDPSPSGALDRLPMRWMCLSNQQLAAQSIVCRGGIRRHLQIPQDCI